MLLKFLRLLLQVEIKIQKIRFRWQEFLIILLSSTLIPWLNLVIK